MQPEIREALLAAGAVVLTEVDTGAAFDDDTSLMWSDLRRLALALLAAKAPCPGCDGTGLWNAGTSSEDRCPQCQGTKLFHIELPKEDKE